MCHYRELSTQELCEAAFLIYSIGKGTKMGNRILVVDDDEMNLRMAEFALKKENYEIIKAQSGEEALDILGNESIDLVLLDIEMPKMNGIQTLEKIRADKSFGNIMVMFLTASSDADDVASAGNIDVSGYIKKPFMPNDLVSQVKAALGDA